MTATAKKLKKQVRVYLDPAEEGMLGEVVKMFGGKLNESDVMTMLLSASLNALKDKNYRFVMPLRFAVAGEAEPSAYVLNEPRNPRK